LSDLAVQPKTKQRYQKSLDDFFSFLEREGVDFPKRREAMDGLISDYLEFLSAEGEGRAAASTFLASRTKIPR
jgi:hypothetical protein